VVEIRSGYVSRIRRLGIGAFVLFVLHGLCAPVTAQAGCNHLVVSPTDTTQLASLIDPMLDDLAGGHQPGPASPRPCSGAWCTGQPIVPPIPAGARDWRVDSWAWNAWESIVFTPSFSFVPTRSAVPHRVVRGDGIFHPPRLLPSV
jgi:hypothetical protein